MNVWNQLDDLVAKHEAQRKMLRSLAQRGGVFRLPKFRPPCVWVLIAGSKAPEEARGEKTVFTSFEEVHATLESSTAWSVACREERKRLRDEARAAKKKARRSR